MPRIVFVAAASTALCLAASLFATPGFGLDLKTQREVWSADELERDFLAEFGEPTDDCYGSSKLQAGPAAPDGPEAATKRWRRAIVAIDASGSMRGRVGGRRKMDVAKEAVAEFLESVPSDAEVGLVAFGHEGAADDAGKARSCAGVALVAEPGRMTAGQVRQAMGGFEAKGWTPLASAITLAGKSFKPSETPGEQVVFVVSDGVETCGGDAVAAARALRESDVRAVVNIIGFDVKPGERAALEAVAGAGGGSFFAVSGAADIRERLRIETRNAREQATHQTASTTASNLNAGRAIRAAVFARSCVTGKTVREASRFTQLGLKLVRSGKADQGVVEEVRERLKARNDKREAEAEEFERRVRAELDAANTPIEAERERVRKQYGR